MWKRTIPSNFPLFVAIVIVFVETTFPQTSPPQYPFSSEFTAKAGSYTWEGMQAIGLNLINDGSETRDSLEIRLYLNATEEELEETVAGNDLTCRFAGRADFGFYYDLDGNQFNFDSLSPGFREQIIMTRPVKVSGSYDSTNGEYVWYYPINLRNISLQSGCRIRIDLLWDSRSLWPPYQDLMNMPPKYSPGAKDWSWGAKKCTDGYPADFNGIATVGKDSIDNLTCMELNPYITVYRNGQLIWGFPPDWKDYYGDFNTGIRKESNGKKTISDKNDFQIIRRAEGKGFSIKSDKAVSSVTILNVRGQVLTEYSRRSKPFQTIDISTVNENGFTGGIYFVRVNFTGGGYGIHKINVVR